jgi:hypothetical protein
MPFSSAVIANARALERYHTLSPVSVANPDFELLENDEDKKQPLLPLLPFLPEHDRRSVSSAPSQTPLDHVMIYSDDAASISSVSDDDEDDEHMIRIEQAPRSIFDVYWKSKGRSSSIREHGHMPSVLFPQHIISESSDEVSTSANTYERVLKVNEDVPKNKSSTSRRKIFEKTLQSCPSLNRTETARLSFRKTVSVSTLQKKPNASSLRPSRYSLGCTRQESSTSVSDHSVSFSPQVNMTLFNPPVENWAADGWSDWFK